MPSRNKTKQPASVVTGAAGFLGSHLTDLLLARGHKVIGIDNFITGSVDNIAHLGGNPNFKFILQDVTEFVFLNGPVNFVWHFASPASPFDYLNFPIQTLKVGSLGTHKTLGLAKDKKARFLLASTSEIYGDPLVHPQPENYWGNVNPVGPRGCYDEAKRFAEAMTMAYHREHKVQTRIARIFNTYGPRMRLNDGRVVPAFVSQALRHKPVTVFGKGRQTRCFCYPI
jgi:dTDP-glucose 4,6-dehydratase